LVPAEELHRQPLTATQRLLLLDSWRRSGLPAGDFAPLVGISKHTLYAWKKRFEAEGPAGLDRVAVPEHDAMARRATPIDMAQTPGLDFHILPMPWSCE
jgi:hypothetical protein